MSAVRIDVVDLASGRQEELRLGVPSSDFLLAHWGRDGVRFVRGMQLVDATTGAVSPLSKAPLGSDEYGSEGVAWSRDGRFIAAWTIQCGATGFVGEGECTQSRLHVIDLATGESRQVAAINSGGGTVAFSPDGRRLVYAGGAQFSAGIYLVRLD